MAGEPIDKQAFMDRVLAHEGILYKICSAYARSPADRDDLYQDIVLQLWRSYPGFHGRARFSTWMYRVALNTALIRIRRPELLEFRDEDALDRLNDPPREAERSEEMVLLHRAIRRLKPVDRAIVLMWLDDRSYAEIGETLGLSEKNVGVKLSRIRKAMTEHLQAGGHDAAN